MKLFFFNVLNLLELFFLEKMDNLPYVQIHRKSLQLQMEGCSCVRLGLLWGTLIPSWQADEKVLRFLPYFPKLHFSLRNMGLQLQTEKHINKNKELVKAGELQAHLHESQLHGPPGGPLGKVPHTGVTV